MHCRTLDTVGRWDRVRPRTDGDGASRRWFGNFAIIISSRRDSDLVTLRGELDIAGAGALHGCLARLRGRRVVVDVRHLTFIDAAGMSALVIAHGRAARSGASLVVRGADGGVRRVLDLAGLLHLLDEVSP